MAFKLQINVSDEMKDRIDAQAKFLGITRSALCATLIAQGLVAYEKSTEWVKSLSASELEKILNEKML